MRFLFVGDINGKPGREAVQGLIPQLRSELALDWVVANGENAAAGAGLTGLLAEELHAAGVDLITLGDHAWDQRGFEVDIDRLDAVCRPVNLPRQCPGKTALVVEQDGVCFAVATVLGGQFMRISADNPFAAADAIVTELRERTPNIFLEVHAETTSEKIAMGWFLDGRVAAVLGTHTHVATADARILPRGSAYQTDVGMTGPHQSVLGREIQPILARFQDGMPRKCPVAEGDVRLNGTLVELDDASGIALHIERIERAWPVPQGGEA